jgi:L-threonylcarbamoyladenylate synthase
MITLENDIINSMMALRNNGTILYPTDTIWGIGCDATNLLAIKKIYRLKKREEKKAMIILLAAEDEIVKYVSNPDPKIIDFLSKQTVPTTAIFKHAIHLPGELVNADGSVAIRVVNDQFCKTLINQLDAPLVSTSANISGDPYPANFKEINDKIKNGVDYIVQHRQNEAKLYEPSSIIQSGNDGKIEKIR